MTTATYIPVKQGGRHLLGDNEFEYRPNKVKENKTYYVCIEKRNLNCPATAVVCSKTDTVIKYLHEHNHDSDLIKKKVKKIENTLIQDAKKSTDSPRIVLGNITNNIVTEMESGVGAMRKTATITKAIQRARAKEFGFPPVPKNWEEMKVPDVLKNTIQNEKFLVFDETVDEFRKERIMIFCSNLQLKTLNSADYWIADGTFDVVETSLFKQLFIITALSETGITVPCCFALLPGKETIFYQKVFEVLKSQNVKPPNNFKTDFEKAIHKGFSNVYPNVPIRGCDTHFKRAIKTKLSSTDYGLGCLYQSCIEFQTLIRYLWGLSLVPAEKIVSTWENYISVQYDKLKLAFPDDIETVDEFLGYFEKTWIGSLNWRTGDFFL